MSKLLISNNKKNFTEAKSLLMKSGLKKFSEKSSNYINMVVFEKRVHSFGNFYSPHENEYIAVSGTLLYKGLKGISAIELLLSDFNGNVCEIKKTCIGLYSLIIKKFDTYYIFNDYYGLYDLYYTNTDVSFFLCNSLSVLLEANDLSEVDVLECVRENFAGGCCYTKETPFCHVFKMLGDEYLEIKNNDSRYCKIVSEKYLYSVQYISEQDSINKLKALLEKHTKEIADNFDNIALNCTGGLDSRLSLATLMTSSSNVQLLYGIGDGILAPTSPGDHKIVKQISKKFSLPLYEMNWKNKENSEGCDGKHQDSLFSAYGFYNNIYAGNENVYNEYSGDIPNYPNFMEFGYFLEALRLREWAEDECEDVFSLDDFVEEYYIDKNLTELVYPEVDLLKLKVKNELIELASIHSIQIKDGLISIDDFEKLRWNINRFSDSRIFPLINEFTYSFPIFSIPEIHELILKLPASVIRGGRFQVALIKEINSEMMGFRLFSHRRLFKVNSDNTRTKIISWKNIADSVISKFSFMSKPLYSIYRKFYYKNNSFLSNKIYTEIDMFDTHEIKINHNNFNGSPFVLYYYRQFLIALKHIVKIK